LHIEPDTINIKEALIKSCVHDAHPMSSSSPCISANSNRDLFIAFTII